MYKISFKQAWLAISVLMLELPVFFPSYSNPETIFQSAIGIASVSMFFLSFPMSLIGVPLGFFISKLLGIDPASIGGMYLSLLVLFVMGFVQWFLIAPWLLKGKSLFGWLYPAGVKPKVLLAEARSCRPG